MSESEVSEEEEEEEEMEEPLSLEWPDNSRKQATFLFLLPIVFPLWLTIPDVRDPVSPCAEQTEDHFYSFAFLYQKIILCCVYHPPFALRHTKNTLQ